MPRDQKVPGSGVQASRARTKSLFRPKPEARSPKPREGWHGWDQYADFYDWENRQTMGRRDVRFWQRMARQHGGPILELGCGTGRVSFPVARVGTPVVGIDRSEQMLAFARRRLKRARHAPALHLVRGDIRALPFAPQGPFRLVMAPYGILQSLLDDEDLAATLRSVATVARPGTVFGIDLVSDVPAWEEYRRRPRMRGTRRGGLRVTLVESVRQEPRRRLTIFEQEYTSERPDGQRDVQRFELAFRTLALPEMVSRLDSVGFEVTAVLGDYEGKPWDIRADVWLILARRRWGE